MKVSPLRDWLKSQHLTQAMLAERLRASRFTVWRACNYVPIGRRTADAIELATDGAVKAVQLVFPSRPAAEGAK